MSALDWSLLFRRLRRRDWRRDVVSMLPTHFWCFVERWRRHDGIRITSYRRASLQTGDSDDVVSALELIRQIDPRRYRTCRRQIRYIVIRQLSVVAFMKEAGGVCHVDMDRFESNSLLKRLGKQNALACVLYHEAVHGRIDHGFGILTETSNQNRIERICYLEMIRLARRMKNGSELASFFRNCFEKNTGDSWKRRTS